MVRVGWEMVRVGGGEVRGQSISLMHMQTPIRYVRLILTMS